MPFAPTMYLFCLQVHAIVIKLSSYLYCESLLHSCTFTLLTDETLHNENQSHSLLLSLYTHFQTLSRHFLFTMKKGKSVVNLINKPEGEGIQ